MHPRCIPVDEDAFDGEATDEDAKDKDATDKDATDEDATDKDATDEDATSESKKFEKKTKFSQSLILPCAEGQKPCQHVSIVNQKIFAPPENVCAYGI